MAFGATSIIDNFNRANENPMTGWANMTTSGLQVVSNACTTSGAGLNSSYWNTIFTGADCEAYVTIASDPASNRSMYVYVRLTDIGSGTTDGYAIKFNKLSGTDTLQLIRVDNGSETVLGANFTQELTAGNKFGIEIVGSTLTAYVDTGSGWTSLGTRTDSTYSAAGYAGLGIASGSLDNFGGGVLSSGITGTLSKTLGGLSRSISGVLSIAGTLSKTLGALTAVSSGELSTEGSLNANLGDLSLSATGETQTTIQGDLDANLGDLTLVSTAELFISGDVSSTLQNVQLSAQGELPLYGVFDNSLGDLTLSATGNSGSFGEVNQILGDASLTAVGTLPIEGSTIATLGSLSLNADGQNAIQGQTDSTLDVLTLNSSGSLLTGIEGDLNQTLGGLQLTAVGELAISGLFDVTLASLVLVANDNDESVVFETGVIYMPALYGVVYEPDTSGVVYMPNLTGKVKS